MNDIHDPEQARAGGDAGFDQTMRNLHAQALSQVSGPVHARLRAARSTAARGRAPARGFGWALASGCAALFALVIGLQLRAPDTSATTDAPQIADLTTMIDNDNAVAALEENPDFYLWLASNTDAMPASPER